jgi:hypothetical protein
MKAAVRMMLGLGKMSYTPKTKGLRLKNVKILQKFGVY